MSVAALPDLNVLPTEALRALLVTQYEQLVSTQEQLLSTADKLTATEERLQSREREIEHLQREYQNEGHHFAQIRYRRDASEKHLETRSSRGHLCTRVYKRPAVSASC